MCWSGEASAALATVGLSATAYAAYRKEPAVLTVSAVCSRLARFRATRTSAEKSRARRMAVA